MKRLSSLTAILLSFLLLASCGGGSESSAPSSDLPTLETTLWTLAYDDTQWVLDEEYFYNEEEYSHATLTIPGEDDTDLISIEIRADITEPYGFRSDLVYYGFDEYDYAEENAYDLHTVGGVDCLMSDAESWGDPFLRYFGRVEEANASVFIQIEGQVQDERVAALLEGLSFDLPDIGNEDGPWYWEGEPFQGQDRNAVVGSYTLESAWVPIQGSLMTYETFEHQVAVIGDQVFILSDGILQEFQLTQDGLGFIQDFTWEEEDGFTAVSAGADGSLWLSDFMAPLTQWKGGSELASYEGTDYVVMAPSGQWGISWFSPECDKVDFSSGTMTTSSLTLQGMESVSSVSIGQNYIIASGFAEGEDAHKVFVFDTNGAPVMTLTGPDDLGSVTYVAETANGFLALDGNMREIVLWAKDGTYIGTVGDGDLFGTDYPWFAHGTQLEDGSILVIMTEERPDRSAMEVIAFRLTGF